MTWIGKQDGIDAVNWGWSVQNDQLIQIMSQMTAAPDSLLKVIHCNAPVLSGHSAVLAEDTVCHELLRATFVPCENQKTVYTTDFFQMNRKMKMISNWMF